MKSHNAYWINALLSSPTTHLVNAIGNAANSRLQPLNVMVGGTIVKRDLSSIQDGLALYKALYTGLGDSWTMARKAFSTENSVLGGARTTDEIKSAVTDSKAGWAQFLRFPTRLLGASDEFFQQLN